MYLYVVAAFLNFLAGKFLKIINKFLTFYLYIIKLAASGVSSLLIFAIGVYNSTINTLGWCYWVSLGALVLDLFSFVFISIYTIQLK